MPVATNFCRFRKLAAQLRLRIWKFALPDSRILILRPRTLDVKQEHPYCKDECCHEYCDLPKYSKVTSCVSGHSVSAILSACSESLIVALEHYGLMLACAKSSKNRLGCARTYFDCSVDMLYLDIDIFTRYSSYLPFHVSLSNTDSAQLSQVEHLAVRIPQVCFDDNEAERYLAFLLNHFPVLLNLHVVIYPLEACTRRTHKGCDSLQCLEKNFTADQRADFIFTKGHIDLVRNIRQYPSNKIHPELHPRMQHYRNPSEIKKFFLDENELKIQIEACAPGYGSAGRKLPKIEYQTVAMRQLAEMEKSERKEYYAEILEAQKNGIPEKHHATSEDPQ